MFHLHRKIIPRFQFHRKRERRGEYGRGVQVRQKRRKLYGKTSAFFMRASCFFFIFFFFSFWVRITKIIKRRDESRNAAPQERRRPARNGDAPRSPRSYHVRTQPKKKWFFLMKSLPPLRPPPIVVVVVMVSGSFCFWYYKKMVVYKLM